MGRSTFSDLVNPTHRAIESSWTILGRKKKCAARKRQVELRRIPYILRLAIEPIPKDDPTHLCRGVVFFFGIAPFFLHASACGRRIYAIFISLLFSLWARNPFPRSEVDNRRGQVNCGLVRGRSAHESPGMIRGKIGLNKTDRIVTAVRFGKECKKKFLEIFTKYKFINSEEK